MIVAQSQPLLDRGDDNLCSLGPEDLQSWNPGYWPGLEADSGGLRLGRLKGSASSLRELACIGVLQVRAPRYVYVAVQPSLP